MSLRSTAGPGQAFNYARNDRRAGCSGSGDDVAGAGKATSAPGAIAQALKDDLLDGAIAPGTRLTEEALSARLDAMCSYRSILEMGRLAAGARCRRRLQRGVPGRGAPGIPHRGDRLASCDRGAQRGAPAIVEASGNARLVSAHRSCQDELNVMLATIRRDFSARRLAILHRDLLEQLYIGGDVALRALESDLELGGRAGMLLALRRQRGTTTPAIA